MPLRPRRRRRAAIALLPASVVTAVVVFTSSCATARVDLPDVVPATQAASPEVEVREIAGPVRPEDTGVTDGVTLRPSGGLSITQAGTVIEGLDVAGCVDVLADDVTIRNTRIRCGVPGRILAVEVGDGVERLTIEQSEIDGAGVVEVGVGWSEFTLTRVDIHGVTDGARFGYRVTVEECWIHDMVRIKTLHPDALQTTSAGQVVIRGNVLDPSRSTGDDHDFNNAGLQMGSELGTKQVRDVLVEHNKFDGGNYSLNVSSDIDAKGVVIRDNVFGDRTRYGAVLTPARVPLGEGNVAESTGQPVEADPAG